MLVQEFDAVSDLLAAIYVVVLEETNIAVDFENGKRNFFDGGDAVLAQAFFQVVHAHVFAGHGSFHNLAIVH